MPFIQQINPPVSYCRVRETVRIWSIPSTVLSSQGVFRPHEVLGEWSICKRQDNKYHCFSKRNPMLNTGKLTANRSCLRSAYSPKLELSLPNSLAAKRLGEEVAMLGFTEGYEKAGPRLHTIASARCQSSSRTELFIARSSAWAGLASAVCEGKGLGSPGLHLQ